MNNYKFDTLAVTGGFASDEATGATNVPLYLTNAYQFKSAENAANLFDLSEAGYIYTRMHNPTTTVLEERAAALEGGVAAVATSSGHFAELAVFATLCQQGDEILASSRLYGGTANLLGTSLNRFDITTRFINQYDINAWEKNITDRTKIIYLESLANPDSRIPDFEKITALGAKYKIPVVVDNTMATPYLFRPVEVGANIVVHSTTKYFCGNGSAMGGIVVDLGNFDWQGSGRFPEFSIPDESYHGLRFVDTFGSAVFAVRLRVKLLRDWGGTPSPFNSFLTLQGVQTLHLRMPRHVENAEKVARFLQAHPQVASVSYPGLESHPDHGLAKKYFSKGAGAVLTFEIKGGYEAAKTFIESLKLCIHAVNLGDARTVLTHPASTTHRQCNEEALTAAGISSAMLRVSVGIEDSGDIIADLENAFKAVG